MKVDRINLIFSPDVELLLIDNRLYRLNCNNEVNELAPKMILNAISDRARANYSQPRTVFSSCHGYLARASGPWEDPETKPSTLYVFKISYDTGEITGLNISLEYLELLAGFNVAGFALDFHPVEPRLGVACWANGETSEIQSKFVVLDLPSMRWKSLQLDPHKEIPWMSESIDNCSANAQRGCFYDIVGCSQDIRHAIARFSDCGHYVKISDGWKRQIVPLKCSQVDLKSPCRKPLFINSRKITSINCFFDIQLYIDKQFLLAEVMLYTDELNNRVVINKLSLTTCPAHLRNAKFALLLGEEQDSNLRVVFWNEHDPLEMKYLNFTWADFLSRFELDFSSKCHGLGQEVESID